MNYPFWELTTFGGGFFIALIAVLHVFVSHFAVSGGLFLPLFEAKAYKMESPAMLDYVKRHTRFFLLLTMVFGGMTGVGIWFTISILAPDATSTLIHTFVFGWAAEWVCFLAEIVALLLYYYRWDKMGRKDHLTLGWLYFVFAWLSLFLINGIVGFMLTPGGWLEGGGFWAGFFNPSFWPSLFFRSFMAMTIAGIFGFVTAHKIQDSEAREAVYRTCVLWTTVPLVLAVASGLWYFSVLPPQAMHSIELTGSRLSGFQELIPLFAAGVFVVGALMMIRLPRQGRVALSMALMMLGLGFIGSFEFTREAARKPFIIHNYMYSNQLRPEALHEVSEAGILSTAAWASEKKITPENMIKAGEQIFQLECASCHSIGGPMNDIMPLTAKYPLTGMDAKISGMGKVYPVMPIFAGTAEERMALATYIVNGLHGGKPENKAVKPKELALEMPSFDEKNAEYVLLAWNNLGMHCISDSYSEWLLLPPANDIQAQLILRGDVPKMVTEGVVLSYFVEPGFEEPAKLCDFWKHAESLFGSCPPDNIGLSGNGLKGEMKYHEELHWFEATLIPVKPYPETGGYNPYPVFTVQARDKKTGKLLAETKTVAPTSTEMGCKNCHGGPWKVDGIAGISQETGRDVIKSHDRLSNTELVQAAMDGKPRLCQSCHPDPVLGAKGNPELLNLPASLHGFHANYLEGRGSEACAYCHPNRPTGPTKCLRGLHGVAGIGCVDCHGYLEDHALSLLKHEDAKGKAGAKVLMEHLKPRTVATKAEVNERLPWMQEPDCANCHKDIQINSKATPKVGIANAFNTWTENGHKLYRNSLDMNGAVACIACHNSPHANYPAVNRYGADRDNIGPMQYQGLNRAVGANGNCAVCHKKEMAYDAHHLGKMAAKK